MTDLDVRPAGQHTGEIVVIPLADLEESLSHEIPCGGIQYEPRCRRSCDKAAVLRGHGHDCPGHSASDPAFFKCIACWQAWYVSVSQTLAACGFVTCGHCGRGFTTIESFNDYRPF